MIDFPLKFEVKADATPGVSTTWQCSANNLDPIKMSLPLEFHGPGKAYTPEDLYGLAVLNCIFAVYKAISEKNNVVFEKIEGSVQVFLDKKHENGNLVITKLDIKFLVTGAKDKEKARTFLEKAIKDCPVSNSIKAGKTYHIDIS
ncbi:MAG: hypothetical protein K1060chlam1_01246 [Candidatus Anoxychlamydiales bacterium]|nr:hypothetical protein [Candidatus Anoxychlamydiales bacterium]